jgi:hypothetical protein
MRKEEDGVSDAFVNGGKGMAYKWSRSEEEQA